MYRLGFHIASDFAQQDSQHIALRVNEQRAEAWFNMLLQRDNTDSKQQINRTKNWTLRGAMSAQESPMQVTINTCPFRIGRSPQNDLVLPTGVVSSRHAEILESAGLLFVRDMGSTNGTFVNGRRIKSDTLLSEGDLIEFGDAFFRVVATFVETRDVRTEPLFGKTMFFHDSDNNRGPRSLQLLLKDENLLPCFQGIHCLKTGQTRGYEYLARTNYPGIENAGSLFEQAHRVSREVELSQLCRKKAMEFSVHIDPAIPVFLNTHPAEPLLELVVPQMRQIRDKYPDQKIVLEINEGAITEPVLTRELRRQLNEFNVRLAFDDFGRGQARIRELICAPSDYVKFDAALIRDLQSVSPEQFRFFASIIQGIKSEGAITIAEGVETEAMAQVCRDIGFDLVQGYLFSRPALLNLS